MATRCEPDRLGHAEDAGTMRGSLFTAATRIRALMLPHCPNVRYSLSPAVETVASMFDVNAAPCAAGHIQSRTSGMSSPLSLIHI